MDRLAQTVDILRRLMKSADTAATMVAEQRIEEFLTTEPQLDRKIEVLKRVQEGISPTVWAMQDYPKKQLAEAILEYVKHRLRTLEDAASAS